jgi:hypothetical protein
MNGRSSISVAAESSEGDQKVIENLDGRPKKYLIFIVPLN